MTNKIIKQSLQANIIIKNAIAGEDIEIGSFIELNALSKAIKAPSNSTGVYPQYKRIAIEDAIQGKKVQDKYSTGQNLVYAIIGSGDRIYANAKQATNFTVGDDIGVMETAGEVNKNTITTAGSSSGKIGFVVEAKTTTSTKDLILIEVY